MTDDEKREMSQSDERARQMLERTETMPVEQLMKLHGVLRGLRSLTVLARRRPMNEWEWQLLEEKTPLDHLEISGVEVRTGSRVRLRPRKGGDVMDIALAGQIATIECIEQDYEGKQPRLRGSGRRSRQGYGLASPAWSSFLFRRRRS